MTYRRNASAIEDIISTHTLTWSVTVGALFNEKEWEISTHTLTWSVTQM